MPERPRIPETAYVFRNVPPGERSSILREASKLLGGGMQSEPHWAMACAAYTYGYSVRLERRKALIGDPAAEELA